MPRSSRPPRLATWLLSHFRPRGDLDLLLGDLEEEYADILHRSGYTEARRWYWRQTLRSLPNLSYDLGNWNLRMFKTYLIIALRHLKRHLGYSAINIVGLAVGLAACLVIGLFVVQKLAYDRFHPDADHIYRVYQDDPEVWGQTLSVPFGLAYALETEVPSIKATTELNIQPDVLIRYGGEPFSADAVKADSNFFTVFDGFQLLRGNPQTALRAPNQMVVTERFATTHFGSPADAMGGVLHVDGTSDYEVVGVVANPPVVSHFDFDLLLSLSEREQSMRFRSLLWPYYASPVYMKVENGTTVASLQEQVTAFEVAQEKPDWMADSPPVLRLQPLLDIHLKSAFLDRDVAPQSDIRYLYLFGAIGLLILAMAAINYINLSTARAVERSREVGVRKALGARRPELVQQFLLESGLVVGLALVIGLGLIYLVVPTVNQMTGEQLSLAFGQQSGRVLLLVVGIGGVVALAAGSYPAFYLSRFKPMNALKGTRSTQQRSRLRQGLIVFQFAMSVLLAVGTLLVHQQLRYIQDQDLGFDQDQVITVRGEGLDAQYTAFKTGLLQSPTVAAVSAARPLGLMQRTYSIDLDEEMPGRQELDGFGADADFFAALRPRLLQGRWFSEAFPTDAEEAVVLTESAVNMLHLSDQPVGQTIDVLPEGPRTVVGVIADIHNGSLHTAMRPTAFFPQVVDEPWTIMVRLRQDALQQGLEHVSATWNTLVPERPISYQFLSDRIALQYQREQRLASLFSLFAGLALLIACLGLFGLSAFMAAQRTKEISIRKVLGATTAGLVAMLSRTYLGLILVGFFIALPLAVWSSQQWLQAFAYHVDLSPWLFAGAFVGVTALATGAVASQAWRAARTNPADALRHS